MEASSSRGRTGSAGVKCRREAQRRRGSGSTSQSLNDDTLRSIFSRLDDHFDLARCSAVCKSWATLCRMKSGSILTEVGDKIVRLWSAESCKYMNEYNVPNGKMLVDFDFDENKIVGLTSSLLCIWRRSEPRSIFQNHGASFGHGLCMSYADPEVVIGCEDGRAFVYDMYSRSCSSIYRLHSSPVTCLTITDDQLVVGGSTFGNVAIADQTSGQKLGILKSAFAPTAIRCLSFSTRSHLVFAGSSAGYAHCWDLRWWTGPGGNTFCTSLVPSRLRYL